MTVEFEPWPKIARLNRSIVITEKLDGTNAAVLIVAEDDPEGQNYVTNLAVDGARYTVYAQSRNKFITPGKATDNYGFAGWVHANAEALVAILGEGRHFGEWWGSGIQSGYGLTGGDKRFSLFNAKRWSFDDLNGDDNLPRIAGLGIVPVMYDGLYDDYEIESAIDWLRDHGSVAAPGFMKPEGIVVYHEAARTSFKITLEGDAAPKGAAGHALDNERIAA